MKNIEGFEKVYRVDMTGKVTKISKPLDKLYPGKLSLLYGHSWNTYMIPLAENKDKLTREEILEEALVLRNQALEIIGNQELSDFEKGLIKDCITINRYNIPWGEIDSLPKRYIKEVSEQQGGLLECLKVFDIVEEIDLEKVAVLIPEGTKNRKHIPEELKASITDAFQNVFHESEVTLNFDRESFSSMVLCGHITDPFIQKEQLIPEGYSITGVMLSLDNKLILQLWNRKTEKLEYAFQK